MYPESEMNKPAAEREVCWNDLVMYQGLSGFSSTTQLWTNYKNKSTAKDNILLA